MKRFDIEIIFIVLGMFMVLTPSIFNIDGMFQYVFFVGGVLVAAFATELAGKIKSGK